jgi:5,10-methylenetetrahydromethanopterin reductase
MDRPEFWLHGFPVPTRTAALAAQAEAWGFDGLLLADSQMLVADPYIELTLAAQATSTLRLGPGVTNPLTRHPAVTAAAVATLHVESGGRAAVVLGRGDSAVLQLGREPATTAQLRQAVLDLRRYLDGSGVPTGDGLPGRLGWFAAEQHPPIRLTVAASGPATIRLAAEHADAVDITVGADLERVSQAVTAVRTAAAARTPAVSIGAFVNVGVSHDLNAARSMVRGSVAIFAHFLSQGPTRTGTDTDRPVLDRLGRAYAEARHGLSAARHSTQLPDEFVDRFAVVGTPEQCVARFQALAAAGVERFVVVPGSRDADPRLLDASNELFAREVLPALRATTR